MTKLTGLSEETTPGISDITYVVIDPASTPGSRKVTLGNLRTSLIGTIFNVVDYGATGDGATDDRTAINSAIAALNAAGSGILYFPPGTYKVTDALTTITVPFQVVGAGGPCGYDGTGAISQINCTSATAVLFTSTAYRGTYRDIAFKNTAGGTPSAGTAVLVDGADETTQVNFERVSSWRFYDGIDIKVGSQWTLNNCFICAPIRYGLRIRNTINADSGDWCISNTEIYSAIANSDAGIRIESSGGGKILNLNINKNVDGFQFTDGISLQPASSTTILLVSNSSIENIARDGFRGTGTVGVAFSKLVFMGCQFGLHFNTTGSAIKIINTATTQIYKINILGCHFIAAGGTGEYAIDLDYVDDLVFGGCTNTNFVDYLTSTNSTNIRELDEV